MYRKQFITGFVSYSYARSFRKYANINGGKEFPYDFDRPHNFNIAASYRINEKFKISATWTYQTGLPYTPALGKQYDAKISEKSMAASHVAHTYRVRADIVSPEVFKKYEPDGGCAYVM